MAKIDSYLDELVQTQIDTLDEAIADAERRLEPFIRLREKLDRLRSARRALTGGTRLTGEGSNRIRQEDIVGFLNNNPGSELAEIAQGVGGTKVQVSSHLNRGKDERFLHKGNRWYVRDPKNGLNTAEDIEDEDDE